MDRKRIMRWLTGLLFLGMIFFSGRTCQAENADITIVFANTEAAAIGLEVEVVRENEVVGVFRLAELGAGKERRWTLDLDPGAYLLEIEVRRGKASERTTRRLQAVPRATIRIDLAPPPAPSSRATE